MGVASGVSLYDQVVEITYGYLGPAADRFVARQIRRHLNKQPDELKRRDLKELIVWIDLAMNVLVEDEQLVDDYISSLKNLLCEGDRGNHRGR